jgi:electron transfer flavoprotein alpha subunit
VIAVVPVRAGHVPEGGDEAVAEAGGLALLVGEETQAAAAQLHGIASAIALAEAGPFAPAAWAAALAPRLAGESAIVLPGSPDGRDLAPRLAHALGWPLLAGALAVRRTGATVARRGGLSTEDVAVDGPFVATLQPKVRGAAADPARGEAHISPLLPFAVDHTAHADATVLEVLKPDAATADLADAERIVGGGAGLGSPEAFDLLHRLGVRLGASLGGTRVVTDWGWVPFDRQIGTTGVTVEPVLYLAFGISGAVQHTAGLGHPDHIIAVNTDGACPMMALADLAVVADAPATVAALAAKLEVAP